MNERISYLCSKCRFEGSRQCEHCSKGDLFMEMRYRQWVDGKTSYTSYAEKIRKSLTNPLAIKNVIFSEPATIVFWADGTKTVVKCQDGDVFDPEKGFAMAFMKKVLGNKGNYFETVKKWVPEDVKPIYPKTDIPKELKNKGPTLKEYMARRIESVMNKNDAVFPLVEIHHDGDFSRIEDNAGLKSLVSRELMTIKEDK